MATSIQTNTDPKSFPWRLVLQLFTAIVGGYLFVNALSILFAFLFYDARAYAVAYGLILGMFIWALVILWVFSHRTLWRSCGVIWLSTVVLAGLSFLLKVIG